MIEQSLTLVCDALNEHLKLSFSRFENAVVLDNLVEGQGGSILQDQNQVVMTLTNISEESTLKNSKSQSQSSTHTTGVNPTMYLNCFVLFSACFSGNNYNTGLKYLSEIIQYFHSNRLLHNPKSNDDFKKLSFELVKMNLSEQSHLWSLLGSSYMPSVLYKVGLVPIIDNQIKEIRPRVKKLEETTAIQ